MKPNTDRHIIGTPIRNQVASVTRPHASSNMIRRQGSFKGFDKLPSSPFKRQLSLRMPTSAEEKLDNLKSQIKELYKISEEERAKSKNSALLEIDEQDSDDDSNPNRERQKDSVSIDSSIQQPLISDCDSANSSLADEHIYEELWNSTTMYEYESMSDDPFDLKWDTLSTSDDDNKNTILSPPDDDEELIKFDVYL